MEINYCGADWVVCAWLARLDCYIWLARQVSAAIDGVDGDLCDSGLDAGYASWGNRGT